MKIQITDNARFLAREHDQQMRLKGFMDETNYTGISMKGRFEIGFLGEWVFREYLKIKGIKEIVWMGEKDVNNHLHDFEIAGKQIDVKTASKPFYKMIMLPNKQFEKNHRDFYVGVKLDLVNGTGEVMGFATHQEIKDAPVKDYGHGDTKAVFFSRLKPIEKLLDQETIKKWMEQDE